MKKKIAIVHDYLNTYGGGERVLTELHNIWPKAEIFVATANYVKMGRFANLFKKLRIKTSWAQDVPLFVKKPLTYRFLLPVIWGSLNIGTPHIVISSSGSNIARAVKIPKNTIHICYCHTPPRFLYGLATETNYLKWPVVKTLIYPLILMLTIFDKHVNKKIDLFIANSKAVQRRIKRLYNRSSVVVYPPCNIPTTFKIRKKGNYYLVVSRLVKYKNIDLIIKAFKKLDLPLKIVGRGRDEKKLKALAGSNKNIEFLGEVGESKLKKLYKECRALVVATKDEDFGMTVPEAAGHGTPVVAYFSGGLKETVIDGVTGVFFNKLTEDGIISALHKFERTNFDPKKIWLHSQKFSRATFRKSMRHIVAGSANLKIRK